VIANILLLKKILQVHKLYKRQDGGPTGIGVENLILRFGGNVEDVFKEILESSHNERGELVSILEFRKKMLLLNPGINARDMNHDDYFVNLNDKSYHRLIELSKNFLSEAATAE
jgi:hypothetical protein